MDVAQIFDKHHAEIFRYLLLRVGNVETAEDLCSEVFLRLVRNQQNYNKQKAGIRTWLYVIARNLLLDHYQKSKLREPEPIIVPEAYVADPADKLADIQFILQLMQRLTEQERELITLRYINELSVHEIATIHKKTYIATKLAVYRAIAKLSKLANAQN